ncbi:Eco29kI family restriction endonuclease [Nocardiopsis sp. NPDC057823]|uniref:Eco29kI family restriction endonuclease n=1 Tax=Nocardiopsis sp. NPDC057823 TaxID=3346256 RepID=UPI00366E25FF
MASSPDITAPTHFNPLDIELLSRNLRAEMDDRPRVPLDSVRSFPGAGLYALYYTGDLEIYERLKNSDVPIYVGKAEAGNSSFGEPLNESKPKLFQRISNHRKSITEAKNLKASDFAVKHLILDDVWISLGERALLRTYRPVLWNSFMTGFGSNPPGGARKNGRSIWDSIHPGRKRAEPLLCNRKFSLSEMENFIASAIDVSLQPEGERREQALSDLKKRKTKEIWRGAKNEKDPVLVFREDVFLKENERLGVDMRNHKWTRSTTSETKTAEISIFDDLDA